MVLRKIGIIKHKIRGTGQGDRKNSSIPYLRKSKKERERDGVREREKERARRREREGKSLLLFLNTIFPSLEKVIEFFVLISKSDKSCLKSPLVERGGVLSEGVVGIRVLNAVGHGWSGRARHSHLTKGGNPKVHTDYT